jgi:hypothetical protein
LLINGCAMLYTTPVDWQLPLKYNLAIPSENSNLL